ncbi:MAG: GDP-L-fucose synthase [Cyanobacteria bacterium]|nr:GDP-L-fucose synthase [Cyanobacteriota bacterium]
MNDTRIYIAGHTGLVGSAIYKRLSDSGYRDIIIKKHKELDLTRQKDTEEFFQQEKPEWVFLAAAKVGGILANDTYKAEFIYDNLVIALNIIDSSYKYGVKKILNLGSSCIYPKLAPQPLKEEYLLTGELEPTNEPYAVAKIAAIKLCRYYNQQYGTNFISVMPTNLYGPNDNFDIVHSHVLPALIRKFHLAKLLKNKNYESIIKDIEKFGNPPVHQPIHRLTHQQIKSHLAKFGITKDYVTIWGTGNVYREFLYVDDLADAVVFLMEKVDAKDIVRICPDYFVNIGTGKDIKIKDLAEMIKNIVEFDGKIKYDTTKPDGTPRKLLDVRKIISLDWQPKTNLKEGIKQTYQWYNNIGE